MNSNPRLYAKKMSGRTKKQGGRCGRRRKKRRREGQAGLLLKEIPRGYVQALAMVRSRNDSRSDSRQWNGYLWDLVMEEMDPFFFRLHSVDLMGGVICSRAFFSPRF